MVQEEAGSVAIFMARKHVPLIINRDEVWGKSLLKNIWEVEMKNGEFCYSESGCSFLCN